MNTTFTQPCTQDNQPESSGSDTALDKDGICGLHHYQSTPQESTATTTTSTSAGTAVPSPNNDEVLSEKEQEKQQVSKQQPTTPVLVAAVADAAKASPPPPQAPQPTTMTETKDHVHHPDSVTIDMDSVVSRVRSPSTRLSISGDDSLGIVDEQFDIKEDEWHYGTVEQVARRLTTDTKIGLTNEVVQARLALNGKNVIDSGKSWIPLWLKLLWSHTVNIMNLVLLVAAVLSGVVKDWADMGVILFVIVANIAIGFFQEFKSETTMNKLKKLTSPVCRVLRDGHKIQVPSSDIVTGDIVLLKEGDQIPADLRLIHCVNLECNEMLLTGEPIPITKTTEAIPRKIKKMVSIMALNQVDTSSPKADDGSIVTSQPIYPADLSKKTVPVGDRINCAFMSTTVTKGKGAGIVIETGTNTEIGKIAKSLSKSKEKSTPLQKKMNLMGIVLMIVAVLSLVVVIVAIYLHKGKKALFPDALITGVCIAVAIIPESLVAVVTLAMSIGVRSMVKQNAIVRKLAALETLGGITDICSDKTGTLTEGKMTATTLWLSDDQLYSVQTKRHPDKVEGKISKVDSLGDHKAAAAAAAAAATASAIGTEQYIAPNENDVTPDNMSHNLKLLLTVAALCNSSSIAVKMNEEEEDMSQPKMSKKKAKKTKKKEASQDALVEGDLIYVGDPTEIALNILSVISNMSKKTLESEAYGELVQEYPFDSTIKRMSVQYRSLDRSEVMTCTKGAPDGVLPLCTHILKRNSDGKWEPVPLTTDDEAKIKDMNENIGKGGLRVLAIAYRSVPQNDDHTVTSTTTVDKSSQVLNQHNKRESVESELTFVGLVGIEDPYRDEVPQSIKVCDEAGIVVHMLTGDHYVTARAIAQQVGILKQENLSDMNSVMKATDFDVMSDEELARMSQLPLVVARCSPQSKVKMINALHARKRLVAMTGDGINDAPSIKISDIGIAMGKGGSDVTKEAADIILTDDNFNTIVVAVKEGRRIFANIRKFVVHLLSANVAQFFALLIPVVAGYEMPLNPTQILYVNMITGTPCAVALSVEKPSSKIMKKRAKQNLFNWETLCDLSYYGLSMALIILLSYFMMTELWLHRDLKSAQAVSFTSTTFMLMFHAYNCRHERRSLFLDQVWKSWLLHLSVLTSIALQCITLYVPWVNTTVFAHKPLKGDEWGIVIVGLVAFMTMAELYKLLKRLCVKTIKVTWRRLRRGGRTVHVKELNGIIIHTTGTDSDSSSSSH